MGRLPDFFIVGHPKSGTTALYEALRRHPDIYMPLLKEPVFFAEDRQSGAPLTLETYLGLFDAAGPGQLVGEASAPYLSSRVAADRIAEAQPAARIIAVLREPASFLRSLHLELVQSHVETEKDFRKALALEDVRRTGRNLSRFVAPTPQVLYSEHIAYAEQLGRFHARFPRERVLVLIYDDFRRDNERTVQTVLRFLGVDDTHSITVPEANPTVEVRWRRINDMLHEVTMGRGAAPRAIKRAITSIAPRPVRSRMLDVTQRRVLFRAPSPVDADLMLSLRRRYKPEVVAISEYLGRDLVSLWGYDQVA